jgi:phosphoribosylformylglycinamidine synthase
VTKARIYVTYKSTVLDPQGNTIREALHHLGFEDVDSVRMGKYLEVELGTDDAAKATAEVEAMCQQLLANPVIESYRFDLENVS